MLGIDAAHQPVEIKERIGVQLQTAALYPYLTVSELLDLFRSFYARSRPTEWLLEAVDLGERRATRRRGTCRVASASACRSPSPW